MKEQNRMRLEYPCMKFEYPEILRPEELDRYLAMGWFRMRQSVFTCDILLKEYSVHNTVWIRTPLEGYNFSKSLRKLMRRNNCRFSSTLTPFFISQEMEELYQRYRAGFKGDLSETLHLSFYGEDYILDNFNSNRSNFPKNASDDSFTKDFLQNKQSIIEKDRENHSTREPYQEEFEQEYTYHNIFDSWMWQIRDPQNNNKLVAFSVFDKGADSIQSIKGVYDYEYSDHSLGIYSMILEICNGLEHGLKYYYPGYIAPGCDSFDYKLRFQPAEFWGFDETWKPFELLDIDALPAVQTEEKLLQLWRKLQESEITADVKWVISPAFRVIHSDQRLKKSLQDPLYLSYGEEGESKYVIRFNIYSKEYEILRCRPIARLRRSMKQDGIFSIPPKEDLQVVHTNEILLSKQEIIADEDMSIIITYLNILLLQDGIL